MQKILWRGKQERRRETCRWQKKGGVQGGWKYGIMQPVQPGQVSVDSCWKEADWEWGIWGVRPGSVKLSDLSKLLYWSGADVPLYKVRRLVRWLSEVHCSFVILIPKLKKERLKQLKTLAFWERVSQSLDQRTIIISSRNLFKDYIRSLIQSSLSWVLLIFT